MGSQGCGRKNRCLKGAFLILYLTKQIKREFDSSIKLREMGRTTTNELSIRMISEITFPGPVDADWFKHRFGESVFHEYRWRGWLRETPPSVVEKEI